MSEHNDRGTGNYAKYDSMTMEELEELVRWESRQPEGAGLDTDELFYVLEVLTQRRKESGEAPGKSVQEAWAEFQEYYMPRETISNFPIVFPLWLRRAAAVAAVLVVFVAVTASANAFGYDLWGKVAVWTQEFFHFVDETQGTEGSLPDPSDRFEYASLQDALDSLSITQRLAPTWLPDGYVLSELLVVDSPREVSITSKYNNGNNDIRISIRQLIGSQPQEIEKSESVILVYDSNGIAYYIFNNYSEIKANWVIGEFECFISGALTVEEMKEIINSI